VLAELIAPSVASALMVRSSWIPLLLGLASVGLGTFPIAFFPETLHRQASALTELPFDLSCEPSYFPNKKEGFCTAIKIKAVEELNRIHASAAVLRSAPVLLLLVTFIVKPFGRGSGDLSLRYLKASPSRSWCWTCCLADY
jgi:hypothetical protein